MKNLVRILVIGGALTFASLMGAALTPIAQAQFGPPQGGMGIVLPALTGLADGSASAVTIGWEADTGFFQAADDEVSVAIAGNLLASFEAGWVIRSGGVTATGPGLIEESASSTNPSVIPRWDDLDTGIGRSAVDGLALIAGGQAGVILAEASNEVQQLWDACTFANLGAPSDGSFCYCSDCTKATPCAGSGSGSLAKRLNGAWDCD